MLALAAPLCGALVLLMMVYVPPLHPYRRYGLPLGAGLSFLGVLFAPWEDLRPWILSLWQPLALFGTFPVLQADRVVWPLALAWAGAVAGSALVQMGRPQALRQVVGEAVLLMLMFGLAALWGENLLMVLLAWAGFDLFWGIGMAAAGLPAERVAWGVGSGMIATALLWLGALLLEKTGSGFSWSLMAPTGWGGTVLLVAALIRLGVYPFHLMVPAEVRRGRPAAAALLLEPMLAWGLLARMTAQAGIPIPAWIGLEVLAMATWLIGSVLAWATEDPDQRVVWVGWAAAGGVLWAGLRAGGSAAWSAGGAAWALGLALLYLGRGWERAAPGWTAASLIGGLALLAAPLASGGVLSPPDGLRGALYLLGQALLTAAVAKDVLRPAGQEEPVGVLPSIARATGLMVLALVLILAWSAAPRAAPNGMEWGGWVAGGLLGGGLLALETRRTWPGRRTSSAVVDILRWEWAGRLLAQSMERVAAFLDAVADVAEGPGAVLWALATSLLILMVVMGR